MYKITLSRDDLHKLFVESEVTKNEKLIKREIEGIRVEVLRANIAGKTVYETKCYHETFRDCFLNELQKLFIDSKIRYIKTSYNEHIKEHLCYFIIDWSIDIEERVNDERVHGERVDGERVDGERVNEEKVNVEMISEEIEK